jgi:hypothetical protein
MSAVLDQAHELERLLLEHKVTVFGYERVNELAIVRFVMNERKLRLVVPMPDWEDDKYVLTPVNRTVRSITQRRTLYWADVKTTWTAMTKLIGAKLGGIEAGITTFEAEFSQFADAEGLLGTGVSHD